MRHLWIKGIKFCKFIITLKGNLNIDAENGISLSGLNYAKVDKQSNLLVILKRLILESPEKLSQLNPISM